MDPLFLYIFLYSQYKRKKETELILSRNDFLIFQNDLFNQYISGEKEFLGEKGNEMKPNTKSEEAKLKDLDLKNIETKQLRILIDDDLTMNSTQSFFHSTF